MYFQSSIPFIPWKCRWIRGSLVWDDGAMTCAKSHRPHPAFCPSLPSSQRWQRWAHQVHLAEYCHESPTWKVRSESGTSPLILTLDKWHGLHLMFWDELHHHQTIKLYGANICYSIFWGVYLLKVFDSHLISFRFPMVKLGTHIWQPSLWWSLFRLRSL